MNLDSVESQFPAWQKADREWARRAARGTGVSGGPEGTRTAYFYNGAFRPYGSTWGAPFPPTEKCRVAPSPTPTPSPTPVPSIPLPTATPIIETPRPTKEPKPTPPLPTEPLPTTAP
jgi:hypothetical protein